MSSFSFSYVCTKLLLIFGALLANGAMVSAGNLLYSCSGGGIRAAIACFLQHQMVVPNDGTGIRLYGISGGAWGIGLIDQFHKFKNTTNQPDYDYYVWLRDNVYNQVNWDGSWGPIMDFGGLVSDDFRAKWVRSIDKTFPFFKGYRPTVYRVNPIYYVKKDFWRQCYDVSGSLYCERGDFQGFNYTKVCNVVKFSSKPASEWLLKMSITSNAAGCLLATSDNNFEIDCDGKLLRAVDGGCDHNIPRIPFKNNDWVFLVDSSEEYANNRFNQLRLYLNSFSKSYSKAKKVLLDILRIWTANLDSRTYLNYIIKSDDGKQQIQFTYLPLYGGSRRWSLIDDYPTLHVASAKTWSPAEVQKFNEELWGRIEVDLKRDRFPGYPIPLPPLVVSNSNAGSKETIDEDLSFYNSTLLPTSP